MKFKNETSVALEINIDGVRYAWEPGEVGEVPDRKAYVVGKYKTPLTPIGEVPAAGSVGEDDDPAPPAAARKDRFNRKLG